MAVLPEQEKAVQVSTGIPLIGEGIVSVVAFSEVLLDGGRAAYRLAMNVDDEWPSVTTAFRAKPVSGEVWATDGEHRQFVNSSILDWQCSLHLVGVWLATSTVIGRWDEDSDAENAALAELAVGKDVITIPTTGRPSRTAGCTDLA